MKFLNKIFLTVFLSLFMILNIHGQSYMRYKMKNGSFNGFYTSQVDSISHVKENGTDVQKVYCGNNIKTIAIDSIMEVSFEAAKLTSEQDAGEYKIVEFDGTEGFKKAYVDNRAMLIASKTGDFMTNDTILFASAYNNIKYLVFTDSVGRITRYFDGENYILFDDNDEGYQINRAPGLARISANGVSKFVSEALIKLFKNNKNITYDILLWDAESLACMYENIEAVQNNPELRSQRLTVAGLSLAGALFDPIAYFSSILALSNNNSLLYFDEFYGGISSSFMDLINQMSPDYETIEKYKEFYSNKYTLSLFTYAASDVSSKKATLNGSIYSEDGLHGNLYFRVSEVFGNEEKRIPATKENDGNNKWKVKGNATGLKPGTWYIYHLEYECNIDKLQLTFRSDNFAEFFTPTPSAYTGEARNITTNSAIVDCEFNNAEGLNCYVYYFATLENGGEEQGVVTSSNGKHSVTLSGLMPNTTYYYYAVIKDGDNEYNGKIKSFTTEAVPLPDLSGVWTFNQTYFGEKSLKVELVLDSTTGNSATYTALPGFYGANELSVTIYSDGTGSVDCWSPNGYTGTFSGTFNDSYTTLSGDKFYVGTPNWANPGWWVEENWSFKK